MTTPMSMSTSVLSVNDRSLHGQADIDVFSLAGSFKSSPVKRFRNAGVRGPMNRRKDPLAQHFELPGKSSRTPQNEISLLLKSPAKRDGATAAVHRLLLPQTPAYLRNKTNDFDQAYGANDLSLFPEDQSGHASSLLKSSQIYDQDTDIADTTSQTGDRSVTASGDQKKLLSLREQESAFDKLEKENFGLKLKIHFMEENMKLKDPNYLSAAMKENMELKIDKLTLQRESARLRKQLLKAEKDMEYFKQAMRPGSKQDTEQNTDRLLALEVEIANLRERLRQQDIELQTKTSDQETPLADVERARFEDIIDDLNAALREQERRVDEQDLEIEKLKEMQDQEHFTQDADHEQEIKQELELCRGQLGNQKQEHDRLMQELAGLKHAFERSQASERQLASQLAEAKSRKDEELLKLHDLHNNEVQAVKTDYFAEFGRLESAVTKLEAELFGGSELADKIPLDDKSIFGKIDRFKRGFSHLIGEHDRLSQNLERARQQRRQSTADRDQYAAKLEETCEGLRGEIQILEAKHRQSQQEVQRQKAQVDVDLHQAHCDYEAKLAHLGQERDFAQRTAQDIQISTQTRVKTLEGEISSLRAEIAAFEKNAITMKQTMDKLRSSLGSWSDREIKLKAALDTNETRHQENLTSLQEQLCKTREICDNREKEIQEIRQTHANDVAETQNSEHLHSTNRQKIQDLQDEIIILKSSHRDLVSATQKKTAAILEEAALDSKSLRSKLEYLEQDNRSQRNALSDELSKHAALLEKIEELTIKTREYEKRQAARSDVMRQNSQLSVIDSAEMATVNEKLRKARQELESTVTRETQAQKRIEHLETQVNLLTARMSSELQTGVLNEGVASTQLQVDVLRARQDLVDLKSKSELKERSLLEHHRKRYELLEEELRELREYCKTADGQYHQAEIERETIAIELLQNQKELRNSSVQVRNLGKTVCQLKASIVNLENALDDKNEAIAALEPCRLKVEHLNLELADASKKLQILENSKDQINPSADLVEKHVFRESKAGRRSTGRGKPSERTSYTDPIESVGSGLHVKRSDYERLQQMTTQLQRKVDWLKKQYQRQCDFRTGLIFEKSYLQMQLQVYENFNREDVRVLSGLGISETLKPEHRVSKLKPLALMVLAAVRLRELRGA